MQTGSIACSFATSSLVVGVEPSGREAVHSYPTNVEICNGLSVKYRGYITAELHRSVLALRKIFRKKSVPFLCWLQEPCKIMTYILIHPLPFIYFKFLLRSWRPWEPLAQKLVSFQIDPYSDCYRSDKR